ncbi:MAG: redoxin family protein [Actinomycetales bacterium]|jgi:thioredoxin 2|uniref:Redoxin family protein n=1 Tax=Candidatus Phosphoribacter hodrii TaxID=2953743 RepID=A0A9D7XYU5_9MICO|nr:redoxin family protein [Candidatus Phosphoribacter hodrii]HBX81667.1 thiol reductase thioredoxin [Propionibacteriaceae bacterium]HQK32806.1 thioredoxin domain-containing protein [Phycicoccus sp.]
MASSIVACPSCGKKNRVPVAAKGRLRCAVCSADLPYLVSADDTDFDAAVDTTQVVLLDLWAPWCGPCRQVAPVVERLSRDFAGKLKVVKVNVDDSPRTAQRFAATSIPMLVLLDRGAVIDTTVGAQPGPVMHRWVESALAKR